MADEHDRSGPSTLLFHDVQFAIVLSDGLAEHEAHEIRNKLEENGAKYVAFDADCELPRDATHIISAPADFAQYLDAISAMIPVVKPSWIDHSVEKQKQANPRQYSPDPSLFMTDVVVTCADIPEGDKEAIAGGLLAFGGLFSEILNRQVTHIVALNMDNDKCNIAKAKGLRCKIVLPHWFDDCLRLRRRISENPYLLPDPEYFRNDSLLQSPTSRNSSNIEGASDPTPRTHPVAILDANKRCPLKVFKNKKIMLSEDLHLGDNIKRILKELIEESGGSIVNNVRNANTFICPYREGDDYKTASQEGKMVGNMSWLYWLITHDTWTSPLKRLLHYPLPKGGIKGFDQFTISISNYTGEARVYLEHLIKATGATFTRAMSQANTHLITALNSGDKCDAAREWNIEILNHLWIEESYAKCEKQPISRSAYQTFPPRTHLGEVVGQTSFDRGLLEKHFYQKPSNFISPAKAGTVPDEEELDLEPEPFVSPKTNRSASTISGLLSSDDADALQRVDVMSLDEPTPALVLKSVTTAEEAAVRKLTPHRISVLGQENVTPEMTSPRGAKNRAILKLHEAAADMALFQKEMKRVGGVTHSRERSGNNAKEMDSTPSKQIDGSDHPRKRKWVEAEQEESSDNEDVKVSTGKISSRKMAKHDKVPPITHRMMVTGLERWNHKPDLEQKERNKLRNLGIFITDDPSHVTILLAPHILRTKKFVCAIASAPQVVEPSFLDACIKNNQLPNPKNHRLRDRDGEARMGFRLAEGLKRARLNCHCLLKGWQIFCTEKVKGGFETYKAIVSANGGICTLWKGRTTLQVSRRSFTRIATATAAADSGKSDKTTKEHAANGSQDVDNGDTLYLVSGTSREDVALWDTFRAQARKADMIPIIAKTDWVLAVAMRQRIVWEEQWELREELL